VVVRRPSIPYSAREDTVALISASSLGFWVAMLRPTASISARACATLTPGLRRAMPSKTVVPASEVGLGVAYWHPKPARPAPELPLELARHHADHHEIRPIDANGLAHQRRIAVITRLPQSIAEDDHAIPAESLFLGKKRAAAQRLRPQHGKKACRHEIG